MSHQLQIKIKFQKNKYWSGFTLIEMLLVIAIISLLICILYISIVSVIGYIRQIRCMNNLKQIGIAIKIFEQDHHRLPNDLFELYPNYINTKEILVCPSDPTPWHYNPEEGKFLSYVYHNWGDTPPPKEAELTDWVPWSKALQIRGERFPIVVCPHHGHIPNNPLFIVLRLNGQVEIVRKKPEQGFFSWKL